MPSFTPAERAALISAGGQLAANGINAAATGAANRSNRAFTSELNQMQRNWALEDWHMQNKYNSPIEQMKRFREAGLNPHLIYGGMTDTPSVRTSSAQNSQVHAPQIDPNMVGNTIATYYDTQMREAQTDNLTKQNTLLTDQSLQTQAQTALIAAQTSKTLADIDISKFDLNQKGLFQSSQLQALELANRKTEADTRYTLDNNERAAALNQSTLRKQAEEILSIRAGRGLTKAQVDEVRARIRNMDYDGTLKKLEINLREKGINPTDPTWQRILAQMLDPNDGAWKINPKRGDSLLKADWKNFKDKFK